ncbi:MAG: hypothetical protein LQ340_003325 [Diploschistes diacapsis]|nr:MAG: hypothetical protein LQ340_003325 [Diploschistes diacapsis]
MASRLIKSGKNLAYFRPTASNVPSEDPKSRAQSILDSLPGNSLISKTAILSAGAGVSVWGISNEFLVLNDEAVVAFCLLSVFWAVGKYGGPMYKEWSEGQIAKMKGILNAAREDHTAAVKSRIENVKQMGSVVDVTKQLFEVSKETATLEAQAFEMQQRTALAHEAKAVLDSWVRYEGQMKQREQQELAETVMAKVAKELENPRVLQQILQQSVADVEKIVSSKAQ